VAISLINEAQKPSHRSDNQMVLQLARHPAIRQIAMRPYAVTRTVTAELPVDSVRFAVPISWPDIHRNKVALPLSAMTDFFRLCVLTGVTVTMRHYIATNTISRFSQKRLNTLVANRYET
jgi:hypothetical protein